MHSQCSLENLTNRDILQNQVVGWMIILNGIVVKSVLMQMSQI
jgi:hypothetical protein